MVRVAAGMAGREHVVCVSGSVGLVYVRRLVKMPDGQRAPRWFILPGGAPEGVEWKTEICVSRRCRFWYWMTGELPAGERVVVGEMEGGWRWVMVMPFSNVWLVWRRVPVFGVQGRHMTRLLGLDMERVRMVETVVRMGDRWR